MQFNITLSQPKLLDLLVDLHENHDSSQRPSTLHNLLRVCKCADMDVKVSLKLNYTIETDLIHHTYLVSIKLYATTECISLRKTFTWSEHENICSRKIFLQEYTSKKIREEYEDIAKDIIQKFMYFRVCIMCRTLFKDARIATAEEEDCLNNPSCPSCLFDSVFFNKDSCCVICKDNIDVHEQSFTLNCGHIYHTGCILESFIKTNKRECPICRTCNDETLILSSAP
jgi:hypothetical protein